METGVKEVGCSQDGTVWMRLVFEFHGEPHAVLLNMTYQKAQDVVKALDEAIRKGKAWLETGIQPV